MTESHDSSTELVPAEPIADPGLEPHHPRPTDIDASAERRAERQVAAFFIAAMVFAVLFVVAYFSFSIGEDIDTFLAWALHIWPWGSVLAWLWSVSALASSSGLASS